MSEDATNTDQPQPGEVVEPTNTPEESGQPASEPNTSTDDDNKQQEQASEKTSTSSDTQATAASSASVVQPEPVAVKNLLVSVYNDVESLRNRLQTSVAAVAHNDVEELLKHFENAKDWLAKKVEQYDPDLGKELHTN